MRLVGPVLAALWLSTWAAVAPAQIKDSTEGLEEFAAGQTGRVVTERWRFGMVVAAEGGHYQKIAGNMAVPTDWPEQKVRIVDQEISPGVKVTYQTIPGAMREMVFRVQVLKAGAEAKAVLTFEVQRLLPDPPKDTSVFRIPNRDRRYLPFLTPGPMIESTHPKIKAAAAEVIAGKEGAWEKVEAIYDWVRERIKFEDNRGGEVKSALAAMQAGVGDCDEMTSLFVALCRAIGVPARMVRVPNHCYPEFCLVDAEGKEHWLPCQVSGTRAFGAMPDPRPILQKGDNLQVMDPNTKKMQRYRFPPENLIGFPVGSDGSITQQAIRERVKD